MQWKNALNVCRDEDTTFRLATLKQSSLPTSGHCFAAKGSWHRCKQHYVLIARNTLYIATSMQGCHAQYVYIITYNKTMECVCMSVLLVTIIKTNLWEWVKMSRKLNRSVLQVSLSRHRRQQQMKTLIYELLKTTDILCRFYFLLSPLLDYCLFHSECP